MNAVQPLKDRKQIKAMLKYLHKKNFRDYGWVFMGIHVGLRITDLLKLKVKDVLVEKPGGRRQIRTHINIKENKTRKTRLIKINNPVRDFLREYLTPFKEAEMEYPLFISRKRNKDGSLRSITRQTAYAILREAKEACGIEESVGTHTIRKTWGYWAYKTTKDIAAIQEIYGHNSAKDTLRYICVDQIQKDFIYESVTFQGIK
ncbi:tyrosine-type recombinase/integrase [Aminobacterium sp. UBA5514]|uniref:tyrosine-type recombinase/integrase n=1 Tax=Aminobacterium sp. UBA5514 TaxID=1946036 RepID=UPI002579DD73|nr:tyrosine-type recombinase/integrase [Aminobacterium sp. UBA5514]